MDFRKGLTLGRTCHTTRTLSPESWLRASRETLHPERGARQDRPFTVLAGYIDMLLGKLQEPFAYINMLEKC